MNPGRWVRTVARRGLTWLIESLKHPEGWAGLLLVVAIALGLGVFGVPDLAEIGEAEEEVVLQPTEVDLKSRLTVEPRDGFAWVALGHSRFDKGEHDAALASYAEALKLDKALASERMIDNLIACFGTPLPGGRRGADPRSRADAGHPRPPRAGPPRPLPRPLRRDPHARPSELGDEGRLPCPVDPRSVLAQLRRPAERGGAAGAAGRSPRARGDPRRPEEG